MIVVSVVVGGDHRLGFGTWLTLPLREVLPSRVAERPQIHAGFGLLLLSGISSWTAPTCAVSGGGGGI